MSEAEAQRRARAYVASRQNEEFAADLREKAVPGRTLVDMKLWVDVDRMDMAAYLRDPCPLGLRRGRILKTKFRLGCHELQSSAQRKLKASRARNPRCPCCPKELKVTVPETVGHALFECEAHAQLRAEFLAACKTRYPPFERMDQDERVCLLMGDDTPNTLRGILSRYIIRISASREGRLGKPGRSGRKPSG